MLLFLSTALLLHAATAVLLRGNAEHPVRPTPKPHRHLPVVKKSSRYEYSLDCAPAHKRPHSMSALEWQNAIGSDRSLPGVGMDLSSITPYETVYKDGFYYVTCAKDILFHHGDKHGNGKYDYNLGKLSNVSIIHYTEIIPKEDQELMTHEVCFAFCRTLQHMNYFGLHDGRDCYCTPFFEPEAGDSSMCDAACEGDATTMCGGMTKSDIFEMHMCGSMGEDLSEDVQVAEALSGTTTALGHAAVSLSSEMQSVAEDEQKMWGSAGDPNAAALMQTTKQWAGEISHLSKPALDACIALNESIGKGQDMAGKDFTKSDLVQQAEFIIEKLEKGMGKVKTARAPLQAVYDAAIRGVGDSSKDAHQYYPLMYFVDKDYLDAPSTCSGDWDERTIFKADEPACAHACDQQLTNPECTGFMLTDTGLCFLFSKFKTVQYYTGCGHLAKASFLQQAGPADLRQQLQSAEAEEEHAHARVQQLKMKLSNQDKISKSNSSHAHCEVARKCSWSPPPVAKRARKPVLLQGRFGLTHVDLTFEKAKIAINNLGGAGPDKDKEPIILFAGVGPGLDLKVETTGGKYVGKGAKKSADSEAIATINLGKGSTDNQVPLKFTFVDATTGKPVTLNYFEFSVMDLDGANPSNGGLEFVKVGGFDKYYVDAESPLVISEEDDGMYTFKAYSKGYGCDNPLDPQKLVTSAGGNECDGEAKAGLNQKYASVGFTFMDASSFDMTFGYGVAGNRNVLFSFASGMTRVTKCYAKLEDFEGTDLSPDPSGKNKLSLKEAVKADRCYKNQ